MKLLRIASLVPGILAVVFLVLNAFGINSLFEQLVISTPFLIGLFMTSLAWFWYLSDYPHARVIMLGYGLLALPYTSFILACRLLNLEFPLQSFLIPDSIAPYATSLTAMFCGGYLIQILTYWMPHTRKYVNATLAVVLFLALVSAFGHAYSLGGASSDPLLLPIPFGALIGLLSMNLIIFIHINHMERLYLTRSIVLSFLAMLVAIIGANVAIHTNITKTVGITTKIEETRSALLEIYSLNLAVTRLTSEAEAYGLSGESRHLEAYQDGRRSYFETIDTIQADSGKQSDGSLYDATLKVSNLGDQILTVTDGAVAQKQAGRTVVSGVNGEINNYTSQILVAIKDTSTIYTGQLNRLVAQQASSGRGIILGVSITSSLSILLIIFTPLFIRQTFRKVYVTQEKLRRANKLLSDETTRAEAILTSIGDGLFALDTERKITLFNHEAETLTGLKKSDVMGKDFDTVMRFTPTDGSRTNVNFTFQALQGKETHIAHGLSLVHHEGRKIDVQVSAGPVKDTDGAVLGAIVVFRDRTSEQALETAKDEFVSLASHQLRTPATATKQFLAMFLQGYAGKIDDRQRLFLQQAYDNNELGITIIEDLLNIARLENNRLKLAKERFDLTGLARKNVALHQDQAKTSGQRIHLEVPKAPVFVMADPTLIGMVLDNLITNAIKYSLKGNAVLIKVSEVEGHARLSVSDSGIGIKKEHLHKIFERFTRLEDPQKNVSGTGIGLYLVERIVRMHHAKVKVDSDYGKGTTFTVEFKQVKE